MRSAGIELMQYILGLQSSLPFIYPQNQQNFVMSGCKVNLPENERF